MGNTGRTATPEVWRVVWSDPALDDLASIRDYIGQFNPLAAQRMAQRIFSTTEKIIGTFPRAGRPLGRERFEVSIIWPYMLRYRIEGDDVFILRVRRGARQPED